MPSTDAKISFEEHALASYLGQIVIETFVDVETGRQETIAFVRGLAIPYRRFLAAFIGSIFDHTAPKGENAGFDFPWAVMPIWSRVSIPPGQRSNPRRGSPTDMVSGEVAAAIKNATSDADLDPKGNLIRLLESIEHDYADSLKDPVSVSELSGLFEKEVYRPDWFPGVNNKNVAQFSFI